MSVDQTLAQASNVLVYSSMTAFAGAFLAFATDLSALGRAAQAQRATERVPVTAGAPPSMDGPHTPVDDASPAGAPVRRRAAGVAMALTWLAFALIVAAVAARGLSAGRAPWSNMYEFSITGAAVVTGMFLFWATRRDVRFMGTFVVGPVLLSLGLAIAVLYTESAQLVPALQSYWLVIHVAVAIISSALFTISFSATVLQLVQERRELARAAGRPPRGGRFMDGLPGSDVLERMSYRLIAVSFPLWTFTVVAGAIWAEKAWGRYWGWDPKEVWSFVIWTVYAAYLHARATRGWEGRRAAYLAIAGFVCLMVNYGVVNFFFSGKHSYAGIG